MELAHTAFTQIFDGPNLPFRTAAWPIPAKLNVGEVLVEIELATICGSDLHTIRGHRHEPTPAILGHEAVGRVVQVGDDRAGLAIGDRVTWTIADSCGSCPPCTAYSLPQKCRNLFKYGHAIVSDASGLNGCYASHILLRAGTHIVKVPDALPAAILAPINCALATMVNTFVQLPDNCDSVVLQGAGMLGLYGCALLRERGVKHVFCVDIQEQRLDQIEHFGGTAIDGQPALADAARAQILAACPDGVDAVLEVAGVSALVPVGMQLLRVGGHYGFVGMVHPQSRLDLTGEQVIRKCLTIYGVHNYGPSHLTEAVQFITATAHKYPYESLVSPPFALADLANAIEAAQTQQWCRVAVQTATS